MSEKKVRCVKWAKCGDKDCAHYWRHDKELACEVACLEHDVKGCEPSGEEE